ncbi:MAG: DNA polymerase III subunit gamma/tau [Candidatus Fermentibacteraceae bacterium]
MGYLVFARKWRPQTFDQVLAQDHVTVTLRNAIKSGRVGHSYLFTGPRGVGKTTTARILAKALNCSRGPTPDPCGECEACVGITRGNHLDVMEIDGASNRGIDEIRELRQKVRYASSSGRYKVYIIDEVHMLTNEAFNALLKILEEPPERVVFIFATTAPRKVPATILSRCQRFDFRRIPSAVMADYISGEASREGIEIDRRALLMVCRASGGSMRDALSIMDQLVSYAGGPIDSDVVSELLGLVGADLLEAIVSAMLRGDSAGALESVAGAMSRGHDSVELLDSLVVYLRNLMLVAAGAPSGLEGVSDAEADAFRRLAELTDDLTVLNLIRILGAASREARRDSLPRVALETAVMTASRLAQALAIDSLPPSGARASGPAAETSQREEDTEEPRETEVDADETPREPQEPPAQEEERAGETDEERETREREEEKNRQVFGLFDAIPRDRG